VPGERRDSSHHTTAGYGLLLYILLGLVIIVDDSSRIYIIFNNFTPDRGCWWSVPVGSCEKGDAVFQFFSEILSRFSSEIPVCLAKNSLTVTSLVFLKTLNFFYLGEVILYGYLQQLVTTCLAPWLS